MRPLPAWLSKLTPFLVVALLLASGAWLVLTPDGLLGKADALGYAICHRIAARSYAIADRPLPLCARCSGMYLGALAGFIVQFARGKRSGLPVTRVLVVLGLFLVFFALDGANSYLTFFNGLPHLYEPQNTLRLATGTLLGIGLASMLLPTFHQVAWTSPDERPVLASLRELLFPLGLAGIFSLALATENPLLAYPLALLGPLSVYAILTLAYSVAWMLILKFENRFATWRELLPVLCMGALTALAQISVIDALRYFFSGTWNGFIF